MFCSGVSLGRLVGTEEQQQRKGPELIIPSKFGENGNKTSRIYNKERVKLQLMGTISLRVLGHDSI